ncbi:MAG: hypothetical protein KatS3mg068_1369 [Candidatus Sericytochromatia bacterium]|nr:MAG: hypothetical protein KatS3mg068_1369 [Candidatus Sericytochromatia bacterium]
MNLKELETKIKSKILTDREAIISYSIDASIYKLSPLGIVLIEDEEDLKKIIEYANKEKISLTARTGGTNLTGNAIGEGIILDFSKMNKIISINKEEKYSIVEPGVVLNEFQRELENYGLMYGPDPSSGDMCKLGGMFANNSAGPHTLKYGAVKNNVLELDIILINGKKLKSKKYKKDSDEYQELIKEHNWILKLENLILENKKDILEKRPGVSKNSSGYNLIEICENLLEGYLDLNKLFIGSEGTLGFITRAKLPLYNKPIKTCTCLIYLKKLEETGLAVNNILELNPSALEVMDNNTMNLVGREKFNIPKNAQIMLIVEFDEDIENKVTNIKKIENKFDLSESIKVAFDKSEQENLWKARKAIYPTLYKYGNNKKPINFCDDVVVSAEFLPELIKYLDDIFKDYNVPVAIYGHIGNGNAHINPLLNINDKEEFNKMVSLSEKIHTEVIKKFNGSICGEHGDGRVRAEFLPLMYGEKVYNLFKEVKKLLDPDNLLNPDVKITNKKFTEFIDFERFNKNCATCGKCNSVCPIYDISQDESLSARGWFHILTNPESNYENSQKAINNCINCKNCANVCPAGIDVSEIIMEKRSKYPNKLTRFLFRLQQDEKLFSSIIKFIAETEFIWNKKFFRYLIENFSSKFMKSISENARIPQGMKLPKLLNITLREKYHYLTEEFGKNSKIAYFHGCAGNYIDNNISDSVIDALLKLNFDITLPKQKCSGTPIITYGSKDIALENAKFNIDSLIKYDKIITSCASCNLMLKEYVKYFDNEYLEKAQELKSKVYDISEFILKFSEININKLAKNLKVTYHSSCHLKIAGISKEPKELIKKVPNIEFIEMRDETRCAGGAGSFIIKDYEKSKEIFWRKERAIKEINPDVVLTSCPACQIQLRDKLDNNIEVKSVISFINEYI